LNLVLPSLVGPSNDHNEPPPWLRQANVWRRWTSPKTWAKRLRSVKALHAFLGSNEATYGLREGGAGFHRNRSAAGKAKPTLSAGIVRRVRNADGVR